MTCLANIFLEEAIIMTADSLKQVVADYGNSDILGSVPCQKLFYLPSTRTGISCKGHATDSNKSIQMILKEFATTINGSTTQENIANELSKFILKSYPGLQTDFYLGGYSGGIKFAFELERSPRDRSRYDLRRVDHQDIAAVFSPDTVNYAQSTGAKIKNMSVDQAIDFIKLLFHHEIEIVQKKKQHPCTGYPIDILVMKPNDYFFSAIKNENDATIK